MHLGVQRVPWGGKKQKLAQTKEAHFALCH